jgi:hypothetical protein
MHDKLAHPRRDDLPALSDALAISLPTDSLRESWGKEIRELARAHTPDQLSLGFGRAGGWAAALLQAKVIGPDTFQALETARCQVRAQVLTMIESGL